MSEQKMYLGKYEIIPEMYPVFKDIQDLWNLGETEEQVSEKLSLPIETVQAVFNIIKQP